MSVHFWIWPLALFWFFGFSRWRLDAGRARGKWEAKRRRKWTRGSWDPSHDEPGSVDRAELEDQRNYIEGMEARIAELENRLDFAERLLAGRHEAQSQVQL